MMSTSEVLDLLWGRPYEMVYVKVKRNNEFKEYGSSAN
jgi:hypothetical protein